MKIGISTSGSQFSFSHRLIAFHSIVATQTITGLEAAQSGVFFPLT